MENNEMKAVIWTKYGGPEGLQLGKVEKPVPRDNEVLIRVHVTTVTAGDCEVRSLKIPVLLRLPMRLYVGIWRPQRLTILGQEVSGVVEAVGKDVTRFSPGDAVFGLTGFRLGGYAEYCCLREDGGDGALVAKPDGLPFEEAAAVPLGGLEALHFLRLAKIRPGDEVLVNGAGGSIGTFGVQLAKHYGAEVTAVDRGNKLDMLKALGADHVVDFTQADFTRMGRTYDVIFDVIGRSPYVRSLRCLNPGGRYVQANPGVQTMIRKLMPGGRNGRQVITGAASYKNEDLEYLKELIQAGGIRVVIDRQYPLEQAVEAHQYAESGEKQGNLLLTVRK